MISRRIFAAVALLCAVIAPAHAQNTKAQINTQINTNFPDNTVGQITPQGLRGVASNIVNSIMPTAPVVSGNLAGFSGTTGLLQDSGIVASVLATAGFNAVNCLGIDDTATIQAKINAAASNAGIVTIVGSCVWTSALDFKGHNNLLLNGFGTGFGSNSTLSMMTYSGTNIPRAMDWRDTGYGAINGITIKNNSSAMTGFLVDAGATNPGVTITTAFKLTNSQMNGATAAGYASGCLNISESQLAVIDTVLFARCQPAIKGQNILGQNTVTKIYNSIFNLNTGPSILDCGEAWLLSNVTFEPDVNGRANGFSNNSARPCKGIVFQDLWAGDVSVAGGTWISLTAQGATINGGRIAGGPGTSVALAITGGTGYKIAGVSIENFPTAVTCTSSPTGGNLDISNTWITVTSHLGAGCVSFTDDSAVPALSVRGNSTNAAGPIADIQGAASQFLSVNSAGTALAFTALCSPVVNAAIVTATSGTYTTPTCNGATAKYVDVELVGPGGGGAGSGTTPGNGGAGSGATTFGTSLLSAGAGVGGTNASGGAAGAVTGGDINLQSASGGNPTGATNTSGGQGTPAPMYSVIAPLSGSANVGLSGAGCGAGGSGAGDGATPSTGGGGAGGGFLRKRIFSPLATYNYVVGGGGAAGTAGTSGFAGGAGTAGCMFVTAYFQ